MENPITDAEMKEIQDRCDKATPGPWKLTLYPDDPQEDRPDTQIYTEAVVDEFGFEGHAEIAGGCFEGGGIGRDEDEEFIAHARTDLPRLLAAHKRLLEEVERMRETMEKLTKHTGNHLYSWDCPACHPQNTLDAIKAAAKGEGEGR